MGYSARVAPGWNGVVFPPAIDRHVRWIEFIKKGTFHPFLNFRDVCASSRPNLPPVERAKRSHQVTISVRCGTACRLATTISRRHLHFFGRFLYFIFTFLFIHYSTREKRTTNVGTAHQPPKSDLRRILRWFIMPCNHHTCPASRGKGAERETSVSIVKLTFAAPTAHTHNAPWKRSVVPKLTFDQPTQLQPWLIHQVVSVR